MVPALCTQCGGKLDVDPSMETAQCPYCGMNFVVEKAVQNYNIQHATIEHVDHVNVNLGDSVKSVLGFLGEQMSESRQVKRELRREELRQKAEMFRPGNIAKIFGFLFLGMFAMMAIGLVMMRFMPDDETSSSDSAAQESIEYDVSNGMLTVNIEEPMDVIWEYDEFDSLNVELDDSSNPEGLYFCFGATQAEGTGVAVLTESPDFDSEPDYYSVFKVDIKNWRITEVTYAETVSSLDGVFD